jgi:hypothetical protein
MIRTYDDISNAVDHWALEIFRSYPLDRLVNLKAVFNKQKHEAERNGDEKGAFGSLILERLVIRVISER